MIQSSRSRPIRQLGRAAAFAAAVLLPQLGWAAGGYFVLGYGPLAHQSAGTSTAIGLDAFAGASNPAKLSAESDRLDLGMLFLNPHRRTGRTDSGTEYDFSTASKNHFFALPEVGIARRIDDRWAWGLTMYGNGGLNTEYRGDTGIPGSNKAPADCGDRPGNFFFGCGKLGFDISQVILAPTLAYKLSAKQHLGISPLLAYQQLSAYGFQAFKGISAHPGAVTNQGYDSSFGAGVRVGWYAEVASWLSLGAAYSSRIYMKRFEDYEGLLAGRGDFDIPANYSFGVALRPLRSVEIGFDVQEIKFGGIRALHNGVLNSLDDPQGQPLGSRNGSGFNWNDTTNYRVAIAYKPMPRLTLRGGFAYGKRPQADHGLDSASFNMLAPTPAKHVTAGFTWQLDPRSDLQFACGRYLPETFRGPSATGGLGVGGTESVRPYNNTLWVGWSRHL